MSTLLRGGYPNTIVIAAGEFSDPFAVGIYDNVGMQIISGTGPLEYYSAQDESGPFDMADDTLTAAQQKTSFPPAANIVKFKNTGPDTLTVKAQGYGVRGV
jgi:hypothetical protein